MRRLLGGLLALVLAAQPALANRIVSSAARPAALPGAAVPALSAPDVVLSSDLSLSVPPLTLNSALPAPVAVAVPGAMELVVSGAATAEASLERPVFSEAGRVGAPHAHAAGRDSSGGLRADRVPAERESRALQGSGALAAPSEGSSSPLEESVWSHAVERGFVRLRMPVEDVPAVQGPHSFGALSPTPVSPSEEGGRSSPPPGRFSVKVFDDPERNSAFWRSFLGEVILNLGFQMYLVGQPYFMQDFTRNTSAPGAGEQALVEEVRRNRSLARIAHWVAQGVSYALTPVFTRGGEGPGRWLVRSSFLRAGVLAFFPVVFFSTGLMSAGTALILLLGLIAAQSFFQGVHVTMMQGSIARIIGDPSVTPRERLRANSIRTLASSTIAVLAPALAGRMAQVRDLFGKPGTGGALIYGIYALVLGLSGLIFATIRLLRLKAAPPAAGEEKARTGIFASLVEGLRLTLKDRFLRTFLGLSLIISLFTDPLVFNVLPEYVGAILKQNPVQIDWLTGVPVLGWLVEGLTGSAMGFFGLMLAFSSLGFGLASLLLEPLKRLLKRLGARTEESLLIPLGVIGLLEIPAFWGIVHFPSFWTVVLLYGLQALATGFGALVVTGIHQKTLGRYTQRQMNQILAANSLLAILAAILVTWLYGFVLTSIPVATSLVIAGVAVTALALLRLASPWLYFSKDQRRGGGEPSFLASAEALGPGRSEESGGTPPLSSGL